MKLKINYDNEHEILNYLSNNSKYSKVPACKVYNYLLEKCKMFNNAFSVYRSKLAKECSLTTDEVDYILDNLVSDDLADVRLNYMRKEYPCYPLIITLNGIFE